MASQNEPAWRLSVSTLGCPGASLDEVIALATANGCQGLEIRVSDGQFLTPETPLEEARAMGEKIRQAGLAVSGLATYVRVCAPGVDSPVIADLQRHIQLAAAIGAEAIRVFPGGEPDQDGTAVQRISAVVPDLKETGVKLLVETHDSHPTGAQTVRLVEGQDPAHIAVLWDALHPWRSGESMAATAEALGDYFAYGQIKDAVKAGERWTPVLTGEGELPLEEFAALLQDFSGWVSLEWEKAWHPQVEELQVALPPAAAWVRRNSPDRSS